MATKCSSKTNVRITKWCCNTPLDKGCVSHNGNLYVNLVDGNTIDPALGVADGTYAGAFDLCGLIDYLSSSGAQTVIIDNGDNTFTSTDNTGAMVTWGDTNTIYTFVTNPDGTVTVTGSDGAVTTVGSSNTVAVDNGDGTGTVTNADGSIVNIITSVVTNTFSQDVDGNIVVTPSDGSTPTVLPIVHPDDTDTLFGEPVIELDADGNPTGIITWPVVNADGTATGDTVVQNMAGFISDDLPAPTIAVNNGDGTGSITNPDGTVVPFCAECPVPNTHELDDDGNLVITSGDGTSTTYVINNNTLLGPYTDSDGDGVYEAEVLNPDGTPTGDTVTSDFSALISSPHPDPVVDTDTWLDVTVNADGSIIYQLTDADGPVSGSDPVVIPAPENPCSEPIATPAQLQSATNVYLQVCVDGVPMQASLIDLLQVDSDGDGLSDISEIATHGSDINNPDTDGGGVSDGDEVAAGSDPTDASDDICQTLTALATVPINDAFNGNTTALAWPVGTSGTVTVTVSDAFNNQTSYGVLPVGSPCVEFIDAEPHNDAFNNTQTGWVVKP